MWMIRTSIDLEVLHQVGTQAIVHDHTTNSMLQSAFGMFAGEGLPEGYLLQATGILRMAVVDLLIHAFAGYRDLISINHNYKVPTGKMWSEGRLMLTAQDLSDLRGQTTQNLSLGINNIPLGVQVSGLGAICLHHFQ